MPDDPNAAGQPAAPAPVDYTSIDLDALFADPAPTSAPPQAAPEVTPPVVPQAPSDAADFFLDAGSSKYKTREEATKGFAEKDAAIAKLRQYAIEKNGFDPLTGKAVEKAPAPLEQISYLKDGKRYVKDLVSALSKGEDGAEGYAKVQQRYFEEIAQGMLAPYIPVVREAAKTRAIDSVAQGDSQFRAFLGSEDYRKTLDQFPDIKVSIEQAEGDPRYSERLPMFYKLAHTASLGLKAQEAARLTPPVQPASAVPAPVVRPTTSSSSITPPAVATGSPQRAAVDEALRSRAGRQQLIQDLESRGVKDFRF